MATLEAFMPLCPICLFVIRFFEFCSTYGQLSLRRTLWYQNYCTCSSKVRIQHTESNIARVTIDFLVFFVSVL